MPLNVTILRTVVAKQAAKVLVKQVRPIAKLDFESKKEQFLEQFDEDEVTQELNEGPTAFSRVPALAQAGGNLFSLLGFDAGKQPAESLREYLQDNVVLYHTGAGKVVGNKVIFETDVLSPTEDEINKVMSLDSESKLPWTTRSFTDLLNRGISGLPQYLFDLTRDFSHIPSHSGPAIQSKGNLRGDNVGSIPYVPRLLAHLKRLLDPQG